MVHRVIVGVVVGVQGAEEKAESRVQQGVRMRHDARDEPWLGRTTQGEESYKMQQHKS